MNKVADERSIKTMKAAPPSLLRLVLFVVSLSTLSVVVVAQSGRSWMNGFVFADSDTAGLPGATVELVGDQGNARLRSVRLSTRTDQRGEYSMKDIPYGEYTFRASAEGYD